MNNKILVTGANGQLALSLKEENTSFIFKSKEELDVCNLDEFLKTVKEVKPRYIINLSAYTKVDEAENFKEQAYTVNTLGAKNSAISAKELKANLIYISTDFVFDGTKNTPYNEEDETKPINIYGLSKLKGEKEIFDIDKNFLIIRTSWLYSKYKSNFFNTIINLAKSKDSLGFIYEQVGTPTYAGALAKLIAKIIKEDKDIFGIYHYSNEGVASWYDFAHQIINLLKLKVDLKPIRTMDYKTKAKRPSYSVLSKEKIKKDLNIRIPHWIDSLNQCIRSVS